MLARSDVDCGFDIDITVAFRVSVHGCLNITRDFSLHGRLPGIYIPYVYMEAATVNP